MRRAIEKDLKEWFERKPVTARKPLVLRGARQVGKSYAVRAFCKNQGLRCLEINFERDSKLSQLFVEGSNRRTLELLAVHFNADLDSNTLLFLDEIQAAPHVFARLRYFFEETPELAVIAAGSLLEFALQELEHSVPVGRIEFLHLGPMRWEEILEAQAEDRLLREIRNWSPAKGNLPAPLHEKLIEYVQAYGVMGGMPEAADDAIRSQTFKRCIEIQRSILATYVQDFAKYRKRIPLERMQRLFNAIPAQVGNKWIHARVNPHEKAQATSTALEALCRARVAHYVRHTSGNGVPLGAEASDKHFKILFLDVGLMANSLGLNLTRFRLGESMDTIASGALAEQWIGQHLLDLRPLSKDPEIFYWVREKSGSQAEVDYLVAQDNQVIPVEVKAGPSQRAKSLQVFLKEKKTTSLAVHFSSAQPQWIPELRILRLPFYMIEQLPRLLGEIEDQS